MEDPADQGESARKIIELTNALESRGVIGEAVGVLVTVFHIQPEVAWLVLSRASQRSNVKVCELAPQMVDAAASGQHERLLELLQVDRTWA